MPISSPILIEFSGSSVSIKKGCNNPNGKYKAYDNKTIIISHFISTLMGCINDQDYIYTQALIKSVSFENV